MGMGQSPPPPIGIAHDKHYNTDETSGNPRTTTRTRTARREIRRPPAPPLEQTARRPKKRRTHAARAPSRRPRTLSRPALAATLRRWRPRRRAREGRGRARSALVNTSRTSPCAATSQLAGAVCRDRDRCRLARRLGRSEGWQRRQKRRSTPRFQETFDCQRSRALSGWKSRYPEWLRGTREGFSATSDSGSRETFGLCGVTGYKANGDSVTEGVSVTDGISATDGVSTADSVSATDSISATDGV